MISRLAAVLKKLKKPAEADALENTLVKCKEPKEYRGLGFSGKVRVAAAEQLEVLFYVQAWLEAINSQEKATHLELSVLVRAD